MPLKGLGMVEGLLVPLLLDSNAEGNFDEYVCEPDGKEQPDEGYYSRLVRVRRRCLHMHTKHETCIAGSLKVHHALEDAKAAVKACAQLICQYELIMQCSRILRSRLATSIQPAITDALHGLYDESSRSRFNTCCSYDEAFKNCNRILSVLGRCSGEGNVGSRGCLYLNVNPMLNHVVVEFRVIGQPNLLCAHATWSIFLCGDPD